MLTLPRLALTFLTSGENLTPSHDVELSDESGLISSFSDFTVFVSLIQCPQQDSHGVDLAFLELCLAFQLLLEKPSASRSRRAIHCFFEVRT
jgi:hypothetical protein